MIRLRNFFNKGALGAFLISMVLLTGIAFAAKPVATHHPKKTVHHTQVKKKTHRHTTHHYSKPRSHHYYSYHAFHPAPLPTNINTKATAFNTYQDSVCSNAESELGKRYLWGGTSPHSGFDCSGFSQYVYKKEGIEIPRTALAQYNSLTPIRNPEPGDLVFFRTHGHSVSHVGIYLGDGYFIHSPRTGEAIRVDKLTSNYWKERYAGARRAVDWNYMAERFHDSNFQTDTPEFDPVT